jgi:hypothetical protein
MERREVVNASNENAQADEWVFDLGSPSSIPQPANTPFPGTDFPNSQTQTPQTRAARSAARHACLYFGPSGERCYRPALNNGFCARHQDNPSPTALRDEARARTKKAAAAAGIIAVIWPLIEELLRQLFRFFR